MIFAFTNGPVLLDDGFSDRTAVLVENGRILGLVGKDEIPADAQVHDLEGAMLLPGFIDTQVNGGGGVLFNADPSVGAIAAIGRAHRRFGTTGFLPTLISDGLDIVEAGMDATQDAIENGVPGVLGIHVEGPFLNVKRKGIHDGTKIKAMDDAGATLLGRPGLGRTMVTIAPELVEERHLVQLAQAGVLLCAGHTNATYACIKEALSKGLRGFTHLFNAMSPLTSREPGCVGAALEDGNSWSGIIVDGAHVDPAVLKLAIKCKSIDRMMLVTDAMPSVGATNKSFMLQGRMIDVREGVCVNASGTLAGSDLDMASAVRNSVRMLDLDIESAVRMASRNPAEFLGLGHELGRIAPGYRASMVVADEDLNVLGTMIDGEFEAVKAPEFA